MVRGRRPRTPAPRGSMVDASDLVVARRLGLLRHDVPICYDPNDSEFGLAYDMRRNVAPDEFADRKDILRLCRKWGLERGFGLVVDSNSLRTKRTVNGVEIKEGNCKWKCKRVHGLQNLDPTAPEEECPFYINAAGHVGGDSTGWRITEMRLCHNHFKNVGFTQSPLAKSSLSTQNLPALHNRDVGIDELQELVEQEMLLAHDGRADTLTLATIKSFLLTKGYTVNNQMASRIKTAIEGRLQGDMEESYQKLRHYLELVAQTNPGSTYDFQTFQGGVFRRACFFPNACLQARAHCKPIVGLDDTHLKDVMNKRGVFLTATTKDYQGHIIVFGFALVPVENYENWHWFCKHLRDALPSEIAVPDIPEVFMRKPSFISDRQKGLLKAVDDVFPGAPHRYCIRHIIGNLAKLGHKLLPEQESVVYAMARSDSELTHGLLAKTLPKLVREYLCKIDKRHWVKYAIQEFYPGHATCGELTSNLSESGNNWIGNDCRSSKPLDAFVKYFLKIAEQFTERRQEGHRLRKNEIVQCGVPTLVPKWKDSLEERQKASKKCKVTPLLIGSYAVVYNDPSEHDWRSVNLVEKTCTCHDWADQQFPCTHAVAAAGSDATHLASLCDWYLFSTEAFQNTYNYQFLPIPRTVTLNRDTSVKVPAVAADLMNSQVCVVPGAHVESLKRKPGPRSKHQRKKARIGSASTPSVAMA